MPRPRSFVPVYPSSVTGPAIPWGNTVSGPLIFFYVIDFLKNCTLFQKIFLSFLFQLRTKSPPKSFDTQVFMVYSLIDCCIEQHLPDSFPGKDLMSGSSHPGPDGPSVAVFRLDLPPVPMRKAPSTMSVVLAAVPEKTDAVRVAWATGKHLTKAHIYQRGVLHEKEICRNGRQHRCSACGICVH